MTCKHFNRALPGFDHIVYQLHARSNCCDIDGSYCDEKDEKQNDFFHCIQVRCDISIFYTI